MTVIALALLAGLRTALLMFWETLWPLIFGFTLSGAVQSFVSRGEMRRLLGDHRPRSVALAGLFGAASSSCSYAASAMARSLFAKGADFTSAMVFMVASTNLVLELGLVLWVLIGWQFAVSEYVGGIIMIALLAGLSRFFLDRQSLAEARSRASVSTAGTEPDSGEPPLSWRRRLRSRAGWIDAAGYTVADLVMLRRELVIGYLVAGFLAVLVPDSVWTLVFFRGHGAATSVENVLVGPLIAMLSFVCSIGNVPLAAALWTGGISFGGVVSFIFADLISLPLLLIYRRYYGTHLTLRLLALLWTVMSLAGLMTELLFTAFRLVPQSRPATVVSPTLHFDYTAVLNVLFLGVLGVVLYLHHNRERLGGGQDHAIDPVCGMQVERSLAPARAHHAGTAFYFCSEGCRDAFVAQPERFAPAQPQTRAV